MSAHDKTNYVQCTCTSNEYSYRPRLQSSLYFEAYFFERHHEKTGFLHLGKQRRRSASRLCFRYIACKTPLLPKYKISSL